MCRVGISNRIENARSTIARPGQSFNFLSSEIHFLINSQVHILFQIKGVLTKYLGLVPKEGVQSLKTYA